VSGAFNLQSSADISSSCSHFKTLSGSNQVIRGKFTCEGEKQKPGGVGSSTSSGSSSTSSQSGIAAGTYAQSASITGVLGVIAAIFGML